MVNKKVQRIKFIIAIMVVILVAVGIGVRIHIYNKNGEKNMPYTISKIIVVSTARKNENAEQQPTEGTESIWNFDIIQNNDVYIEISNKNTRKNEKIKNVSIEDIQIIEAPKKGSIRVYMPNSLDGDRYTYTDEYEVGDSLTYRGSDENSYKNLQLNRNGGIVSFSFTNKEVGKYASGEDTEVTFDGRMLSKLNLKDEDLKSKVSFNLIIELDDEKRYSGKVELDISCEGLVENGTSKIDITDFSNIVFKRI